MSNLLIGGTFFLNPNSGSWKSLGQWGDLQFLDVGNIQQLALSENSNTPLFYLICMQDLLSGHLDLDDDFLSSLIEPIEKMLLSRCETSSQQTIIGICGTQSESVVRGAKSIMPETKFFFDMLKLFACLGERFPHFFHIDFNRVFANMGYSNAFDSRNWYAARCRLSERGLRCVAEAVDAVLWRYNKPASKVLVLDCDNTLWGGVIGEDGIDGITLGTDGIGKAFLEFQMEIKKLREQGIVLALASKNNEEDVWDVFDNHDSMPLVRKDIVTSRINWQEKSKNMKEMADELALGLDSFVFWDDNPIEREKAKRFCPEVNTIEVPTAVDAWPDLLKSLDCFAKFTLTCEDKAKVDQYNARREFVEELANSDDELNYLHSINLQAQLVDLGSGNISRAVQLCQKTNQFNLRPLKRQADELESFASVNPAFCSVVSLRDMYGDHGIVGLFCLNELDRESLFINMFLMSCRVLGRHLEDWVINQIMDIATDLNYRQVVGQFLPTKKNSVSQNLLPQNNFVKFEKATDIPDNWSSSFDPKKGSIYVRPTEDSVRLHEDIYNGS